MWTHCCNNCLGKYGAMNQDKVVGLIILFLAISFLHLCKSQVCIYISLAFAIHPDRNSIFCTFSGITGFESESSSPQMMALVWVHRWKIIQKRFNFWNSVCRKRSFQATIKVKKYHYLFQTSSHHNLWKDRCFK